MKKQILFLMILLSSIMTSISAQQNDNTSSDDVITVKKSELTSEQLSKIKSKDDLDALNKKIETYGNWVGMGGEIGEAVKSSLTAVVDVSDKFSKTDVGKFTMIMVAWKIIGKDIVKISLGILFLIITSYFTFYSYKKLVPYKIKTKSNGIQFWLPNEYEIIEPEEFEGLELVKFLHIIIFFIIIAVTYSIMF